MGLGDRVNLMAGGNILQATGSGAQGRGRLVREKGTEWGIFSTESEKKVRWFRPRRRIRRPRTEL